MTANWIEYQVFPAPGYPVCHQITGRECEIHIAPRPAYCDRGNFIATISTTGELALGFDRQDGWPRYYFNLDRAKLEVEAWLAKRGELQDSKP